MRRATTALVVVALLAGGWLAVHRAMPGWYARMWYPLHHAELIRVEADRNRLDPALVAAVIDSESGWAADARSPQGAVGLMQLLPSTADFVAGRPDRPSPPPSDLEDPATNIAYGTRYLRYLVDRHGTVPLALAAYNAGETNVAEWVAGARTRGERLDVPDDIPFPETRAFVRRVMDTAPIYRRAYDERL